MFTFVKRFCLQCFVIIFHFTLCFATSNSINLGTSEETVLSQLGEPTRTSFLLSKNQKLLYYNISSITLDKNGKVIAWSNFNNLPLFTGIKDPNFNSLEIGYDKSRVSKSLGTPTRIYLLGNNEEKWCYGQSIVFFKNNQVYNWEDKSEIANTFAQNSKLQNKTDTIQNITTPIVKNSTNYNPTKPLTTSTQTSSISSESSFSPNVAENGSYYGEKSKITGRPKTVKVKGYYRKDGTYVRGHYRSKPR